MWIELSGVLFAATACAMWRAIATLRDWGIRWAFGWSAEAVTLGCATALVLTMALRHPKAPFWIPGMPWNQATNFGPGWRCDNIARGPVCFRDPPATNGVSPVSVRPAL